MLLYSVLVEELKKATQFTTSSTASDRCFLVEEGETHNYYILCSLRPLETKTIHSDCILFGESKLLQLSELCSFIFLSFFPF